MNEIETKYLIKNYMKENVYRVAKIEIPYITQSQINIILDNKQVNNFDLNADDITTVNNLFKAYNYLYENLAETIDINKILILHEIIAQHQALDSGVIRYGDVTVSGVKYIPPSPRETDLKKLFEKTVTTLKEKVLKQPIEAAIDYLLVACRNQFFWDGNKRTAFMVANFILLQSGNGVLGIDEKTESEFHILLSEYYETNKKEKIAQFLFDKCLKAYGFKLNNSFDINYFS